jgi:hypothetical protein
VRFTWRSANKIIEDKADSFVICLLLTNLCDLFNDAVRGHAIQLRMIGWPVKGYGRKLSLPNLSNCSDICLGEGRKTITMSTAALQRNLQWVRWIRSTLSHPIYLRSVLILAIHQYQVLRKVLWPSAFPAVRFKHVYSLSCVIHVPFFSSSLIWFPW